jgi:UDP-N-acetylglucosamine--N-acetylmuramyl-(pentapeptide) pyrophosphoryl-undecaprenol N-acetylglucosamine transferase
MSTLLISAGGTGGGIYPALAVAEGIRRTQPECQMHFVGSVGGMERDLVGREQKPDAPLFSGYHEVQSGPLHGVPPLRLLASLVKLSIGVVQALALIGAIKPSVLFLTGGWVTFPVAVACWLRRIPIAIFLPDIEPALAIKVLSRLAHVVMTTTAESVQYFPPGTTVLETGYPLREELMRATRESGIAHFQLDPRQKIVLVFGGSRGARSLNEALLPIVPDLTQQGVQILHITGELDWPTVQEKRAQLPDFQQRNYHAFAYLHDDMGLAMASADLVVSRAGASTLGEFPFFGLPAILVPYPFAWRYQKVNADWLVARGAAQRLDDAALPAELLPTLQNLLNNPTQLGEMKRAAAALARRDSAGEIASRLLTLTAHH